MPQTKALKTYKESLFLNNEQISVLVGSLLGDGTLRVGYDSINANFKVEHGLKQKDYVFWKYSYFKMWALTPPEISYRYDENRSKYPKSWWFRTVRHAKLTEYRKLFYPKGVKIIPYNIDRFLNPLSLAVWIMDDGSLNRNSLDVSTYSFSVDDIRHILEVLEKKFSISGKFYKDRDKGYRIRFSASETRNISNNIKDFVIPCLAYKLPVTP